MIGLGGRGKRLLVEAEVVLLVWESVGVVGVERTSVGLVVMVEGMMDVVRDDGGEVDVTEVVISREVVLCADIRTEDHTMKRRV